MKRRPGSLTALLLTALLVLPATGCAWANRANRPVWNAFEAHLVPEDDAAFYATLPLTVPGGLVAILLDTFIVHPAQVVDDAAEDAGELWEDLGPEFEQHYYTQMAVLPFRVVLTPVGFVFSFLGRSMFDIPPHGEQRSRADRDAARERQRGDELLDWLRDLAAGQTFRHHTPPPAVWTPELRDALAAALAGSDSDGRLYLYEYVIDHDVPYDVLDPLAGLADPDPVFRYRLLKLWPGSELGRIPDPLRSALLQDPNPSVRELAAQRGF